MSSHCSALDSSIACYVRIRTEFRLATRNKVHAALFFCGRAISLIVPVLSPASAHTCAGFLFRYSWRPGRGQTGLRPAFGWGAPPGGSGRPPAGHYGPPGSTACFVPGLSVRPRRPTSIPSGDRVNAGFASRWLGPARR